MPANWLLAQILIGRLHFMSMNSSTVVYVLNQMAAELLLLMAGQVGVGEVVPGIAMIFQAIVAAEMLAESVLQEEC